MSLAFSSSDQMGSEFHKFNHPQPHPFHQLYLNKRTLRELDIPPRKLLSRRLAAAEAAAADMFLDSPKGENTLFQKFLPYNNVDEDDADPYSADQFRMFEFKVRKCTRSRSHDWTDCPFAHPGEKARRRDPRRYNYTGTVCAEFRRGSCSRGDSCEFAHGVFECWLHPSRYRTEACKDGKNCKRKVCFFAHTPRQLRILPVNCNDNVSAPVNTPVAGNENNVLSRQFHHCCACCHNTVVSASPDSTLIGITHMSSPITPSRLPPPPPPPHSPIKFSPISRFNDRFKAIESSGSSHLTNSGDGLSYKAAVNELMTSLEAMNVNEAAAANNNGKLSWVDVNVNGGDDQQPQFELSPSTPSPAGSSRFARGELANKSIVEDNNGGLAGPDLGWVNDLLT